MTDHRSPFRALWRPTGWLAVTAAVAACGAPAPVAAPAASAAVTREIGYRNVAEAHDAIAGRAGVRHFRRDTYEVFVDDPAYTVWLFSLPGSAAYPSLIRRQLVEAGTEVLMRSVVFCEADPAVCAVLQENARRLDAAIVDRLGGERPGMPPGEAPAPPVGVRL